MGVIDKNWIKLRRSSIILDWSCPKCILHIQESCKYDEIFNRLKVHSCSVYVSRNSGENVSMNYQNIHNKFLQLVLGWKR
jgi:hypothetical protein